MTNTSNLSYVLGMSMIMAKIIRNSHPCVLQFDVTDGALFFPNGRVMEDG